MRESKRQLQRLLYLDDEPDGVPICEKRVREAAEDAWMPWVESLTQWSCDDSINPGISMDAQRCANGLRDFACYPHVSAQLAELEALYAT